MVKKSKGEWEISISSPKESGNQQNDRRNYFCAEFTPKKSKIFRRFISSITKEK